MKPYRGFSQISPLEGVLDIYLLQVVIDPPGIDFRMIVCDTIFAVFLRTYIMTSGKSANITLNNKTTLPRHTIPATDTQHLPRNMSGHFTRCKKQHRITHI